MTAYHLTNHLFNFMAPAAFVAVLVVLLSRLFGRVFKSKKPLALGLYAQIAIVFIAGLVVLLAGLVFFGRDGKMATYTALVLGAATCQWVLLRGWKK
ncbi:hypothetical protein [Polaromonas sp.]|uniref:hypothetical protein n=1 Tax=Polaromonas sp. TaxID=1869339 RepID=UPI002FC9B1D1